MELSNIGKIIAFFFSISLLNSHYLLNANMFDRWGTLQTTQPLKIQLRECRKRKQMSNKSNRQNSLLKWKPNLNMNFVTGIRIHQRFQFHWKCSMNILKSKEANWISRKSRNEKRFLPQWNHTQTGLSFKLNIHRTTYIVYDTFECEKANILWLFQ